MLAKAMLLALSIAASTGSIAYARIYTLSYTGFTGFKFFDFTDYFGQGPGYIDGKPFEAVVTINDNTPGAISQIGPNSNTFLGYNAASPLRMVLTIGSASLTFGTAYGAVGQSYYGPGSAGNRFFQTGLNYTSDDAYATFYIGGNRGALDGTDWRTLDTQTAMTTMLTGNVLYRGGPSGGRVLVSGELVPLSVTVSSIASVPEPTTWMLMVGGCGALGAALRRRNTLRRRTLIVQ